MWFTNSTKNALHLIQLPGADVQQRRRRRRSGISPAGAEMTTGAWVVPPGWSSLR